MLVDTHRSLVRTEGELDKYTDPSFHGEDVLVFRLTTDTDDSGDLMTFDDAVEFVADFDDGTGDIVTREEAADMLRHASKLHVGPHDDRYTLTPLETPLRYSFDDQEYVPEDEWDDDPSAESSTPFDCRPGKDFPVTL